MSRNTPARPNTRWDLKVFFGVVAKDPAKVAAADVLAFIRAQRAPRRGPAVVRLEDGESDLDVRTIKRRLASVSGLLAYLGVRGDMATNPVPRGLAARAASNASSRCWRGSLPPWPTI